MGCVLPEEIFVRIKALPQGIALATLEAKAADNDEN
jgi:hypothetical protein